VNTKRQLLILDLDETLVYATEKRLKGKKTFRVGSLYVYERPYLRDFLARMFSLFGLAIWTSSTSSYALPIASEIFSEEDQLAFIWCRERCTRKYDAERQSFYWLKDLKKVKCAGFDLRKIIVVDDTARKWARSYGNHVWVRPFTGDLADRELLLLGDYLETLASVANVREIEKRNWRAQVKD
jgi:RNA polymerase II subunit A small phosphatase-like protein